MKITQGAVKEIADSRGRPTIEVEFCAGEHRVTASVPSGKSTGTNEALEKRDADGNGINDVMYILKSEVFPLILSREFSSQREFDTYLIELDGTENKSRIGANGILALSIAFAKLSALQEDLPLWQFISQSEHFSVSYPRLYVNVMNGGAHANFRLPFQEYIVSIGGNPKEAYEKAQTFFQTLGDMISGEVGEVPMGDEGGYSPQFETLEKPFEMLRDIINGHEDIFLAIDAAASEFTNENGDYKILEKTFTRHELIQIYLDLVQRFGLRSIEDPFAENDPVSFSGLLDVAPKDTLIVGDDLTVTNPRILKDMIVEKAGNALIVKPNQIGSLTEVYDTVRLAHGAGWKTIVSHRSGETNDSFIADLAVGVGAYGMKAGAPSQMVRAVKYERLAAIESERKS